jgi:F-type H+-transporting ATPase subunit delta
MTGAVPPGRQRHGRGCVKNDERQVAESSSKEAPGVSGVAGRYALALFDLARDEKALDVVMKGLDSFEELLRESPDLQRLVKSPVYSSEEQVRAIGAVLDRAGISGLTANFIRLVASRRRLFALPGMIAAYRGMLARSKGVVSAEVRLAEEPSPRVMEDIKTALRAMTSSEVDLKVKIDPALIGGLVVQVGSRMIDASLRTKLNSIRIAMKEAR